MFAAVSAVGHSAESSDSDQERMRAALKKSRAGLSPELEAYLARLGETFRVLPGHPCFVSTTAHGSVHLRIPEGLGGR